MHEKNSKNILVDWLTFTVRARDFSWSGDDEDCTYLDSDGVLSAVLTFLQLPPLTEFVQKNGLYGYKLGYYFGGIRVCMGGTDTIMVDMSGEGCRLYESLGGLDWLSLIIKLMGLAWYHFSRLDVACDTFALLKMPSLLKYTLAGRYVSRWKSLPRVVQGREETIDFGSPQSKIMLRIYNKTLERQSKLEPDTEVPQGWVRCELQMRNHAVESFIREWRSAQDISAVYLGIMASHLRFVYERNEDNPQRSELTAWWATFLNNAQPIKLAYRGGLEYNLDSLNRYVVMQAGSSIRAWLKVHGGNIQALTMAVESRSFNEKQQGLLEQINISASGAAEKGVS